MKKQVVDGGETWVSVDDCGMTFLNFFHELLTLVWEEGNTPQAWRNAVLVALAKKGDLTLCDNWRGISLLDIAGKVLARVMQDRLQVLGMDVLHESQCGFRNCRGVTDMSFAVRQLIEKLGEHKEKGYLLFIDLKKAYDSVPRDAMWAVLGKLGVPPVMVAVIRSLHEGMTAQVRSGGRLSDPIAVRNGLKQGCTMAPILFNLYFATVMKQWRKDCAGIELGIRTFGSNILGPRAGKLVGRKTERFTEFKFADDAAALTIAREDLVAATDSLLRVTSQWGLTVSIAKTEVMAVGNYSPEELLPIPCEEGEIKFVSHFTYLGSHVSTEPDGGVARDVRIRLGKAAAAFAALKLTVFEDSALTLKTKAMVYKAGVWGTMLFGGESWAIKTACLARLESFHNRCVRSLLGVSRVQQRVERLTTEELNLRLGITSVGVELVQRRLRWLGHVARMAPSRIPKQMLFSRFAVSRPSHGARKRWVDVVRDDVQCCPALSEETWYEKAQDRVGWKNGCGSWTTEVKKVECERCGRMFKGVLGVTQHQRQSVECGGGRVEMVGCEDCGRQFKGVVGLGHHKRQNPQCAQQREGVAKEKRKRIYRPKLEPETLGFERVEGGFRCKKGVCGMVAKTLQGCQRHKCEAAKKRKMTVAEREELPDDYMCMSCRSKFRTEQHLRQHQQRARLRACRGGGL